MRGDKGSPDPYGFEAGPPSVLAEKGMKGSPALTEFAETKDFELDEQKHRKWFRSAMMFLLPIVAFGWLVLIAWATLEGKIEGLQVGIVLGITGAGLLTLLGLQIAWAHSQKNNTATHPAVVVLKSGLIKLLDK